MHGTASQTIHCVHFFMYHCSRRAARSDGWLVVGCLTSQQHASDGTVSSCLSPDNVTSRAADVRSYVAKEVRARLFAC